MDPYFRGGIHPGCEPAENASVFAIDKNIHVTAKLALFVQHAVAKAGKLLSERLDNFGGGDQAGRPSALPGQTRGAQPGRARRRMIIVA